MTDSTSTNIKRATLSLLALAISQSLSAWANPTGGQVVAGQAGIAGGAGITTVTQQSARAVINWQSFSIQSGETTRFVQPSASAAILNRVVTGTPSQLMGTVQANGQVYLINPNGVLVGKDGLIQTNGFVASTLDVDNTAFMQGGPLEFLGASGAAVSNIGTIHAASGDVILMARQVDNAGDIKAPQGVIGLGAGTRLLLASSGAEHIAVQPDAGANASVINSGTLSATQAELKAAGGNPYALAVNAGGSISAIAVNNVGGKVFIGAPQGTAQVTGDVIARNGDSGGTVQVTGNQVQVGSAARINASGSLGGGTVLIGGDYQGGNAAVQNAQNTSVAAGAILQADATTAGNGGKIVVWSDGQTDFAGSLRARGGPGGGNGGKAEVSGKEKLAFTGQVDLRAPNGKTGDLLLDPTDITITDGTATGSIAVSGNTSTITLTDLNNALAGANVTISTNSTGTGNGDITLSALSALISGTNSLTLSANRDITLNGNLMNLDGGSMTLLAGRNLVVTGDPRGPLITAQNLTLVADAVNGGAGAGTMSFPTNMAICSDRPQLFAPMASSIMTSGPIDFSSFTSAQPPALSTTIGKWYGDSGTSGAGYFYRSSGSASNTSPGNTTPPGTNLTGNQIVTVISPNNNQQTQTVEIIPGGGDPIRISTANKYDDPKLNQDAANLQVLLDWVKKDGSDKNNEQALKNTEQAINEVRQDIDLRLFARWAGQLLDLMNKPPLSTVLSTGYDEIYTKLWGLAQGPDHWAQQKFVEDPKTGHLVAVPWPPEVSRVETMNDLLKSVDAAIGVEQANINTLTAQSAKNISDRLQADLSEGMGYADTSARKNVPNLAMLFDPKSSHDTAYVQKDLDMFNADIKQAADNIMWLTKLRAVIDSAKQNIQLSYMYGDYRDVNDL